MQVSFSEDWSSHGGWQALSTPPRKPSKQHVEDSPQGSAESNLGLLASFKPTREFYDAQEVFGLTFPRKIQASAWATKHGLAGRNLEEIRLHELTWQGWSNHNLRALTQGRYVSFARSIKEATFISYLLQHLREHKLDLDRIAECFCADSGIQVSSTTPENAKKPFRMQELARWVVKQLQPYQTAELADAQDRIKELERQLAQQRKRTLTEAEIGAEPIRSSQPSEPSQPEGAPSSKRVRIVKLRLKDELKAQLQQSCKVAAATLKSCTEEEIHILHQRAVDFGFPVRHLKEAKDGEILKRALAACALASWMWQ